MKLPNNMSYIVKHMYDIGEIEIGERISLGLKGPTGILIKRENINTPFLPELVVFQLEEERETRTYLAYPQGFVTKEDAIRILNEEVNLK